MVVAGRSAGKAAESAERLLAEGKLSIWRCHSSTNTKARRRSCCFCALQKVYIRACEAEHPNTRAILAESLKGQGKYADAERIERGVLEAQKRVRAR